MYGMSKIMSFQFIKVLRRYLSSPEDGFLLAGFRVLFGTCLLFDIFVERGLANVDKFKDPDQCYFPLFAIIQPPTFPIAAGLYLLMTIGCFGIIFGVNFKLSCFTYLLSYIYFFILDKSRWNNHSYLYALLVFLLSFTGASNQHTLHTWRRRKTKNNGCVPRWNYSIFKFQLFILYFYAGFKKLMDPDWVDGWSMKHLAGKHGLPKEFDAVVHIGGLAYDLTIGFMLLFGGKWIKRTGFFFSLAFHLSNAYLFDIGMFPYVCLCSLLIFCDKPRTVTNYKTPNMMSYASMFYLLAYCLVQLFLPFSHFITKGYNNWTPGLYGYSWDMMISSWVTLHQKVVIKGYGPDELYLADEMWVSNDRWSTHADMAFQYAKCIKRNLPNASEVHFDIWKSLNGRFYQRMFNPNVNLLTAKWSLFENVEWLMPLMTEYSHLRNTFDNFAPSNGTNQDVVFMADFAGMTLDNYLPQDTEVSIGVIDGVILVETDLWEFSLRLERNATTKVKGEHRIHSLTQSAYYYRYDVEGNRNGDGTSEDDWATALSLYLSKQWDQFQRGLSLLHEGLWELLLLA